MTAWSAIVFRDGQQVTGPVPCDDWDAAGLVARFFAIWPGGRVSVANAVVEQRVADHESDEMFEGVA